MLEDIEGFGARVPEADAELPCRFGMVRVDLQLDASFPALNPQPSKIAPTATLCHLLPAIATKKNVLYKGSKSQKYPRPLALREFSHAVLTPIFARFLRTQKHSWILDFGVSMEFGVWYLKFSILPLVPWRLGVLKTRCLKTTPIARTLKPLLMFSLRKTLIAAVSLLAICAHAATELLAPGFRPVPAGVHALVGATVVVKPGQVISNATVVIRAGKIEKVGANISIPPDARVWNLKSNTIYAGFIDPYLTLSATGSPDPGAKKDRNDLTAGIKFFGVPGSERDPGAPGPGSELPAITPERRMAKTFAPDAKSLEAMRELGFTTANVVPDKGIIRGTSVFVALGDTDPNRAIIRPDVFQHVGFEEGVKEDAYPESLMGVVAAVRQTFFDAQHALRSADVHVRSSSGMENGSEYNPALDALAPAVKKQMRVAFEPRSALMVDRAARVAREIGLDFCILSSGQEWRRPDLAKATAAPFIVPLNFPEAPKLPTDDDWTQVSLDQLRAWDWAPENAALLRRQKLEIALTTFGLEDKKTFRKNLKLAIQRGLSESDALAALTTVPATLCGLENQLGTIEAGKYANLTVVNGKGYFDPESKVQSVWIDGRFYRTDSEEPKTDGNTNLLVHREKRRIDQNFSRHTKSCRTRKISRTGTNRNRESRKRETHENREGEIGKRNQS